MWLSRFRQQQVENEAEHGDEKRDEYGLPESRHMKPRDNPSHKQKDSALMTIRNNPRVRTVTGRVRTIRIGLRTACATPNSNPDTSMVEVLLN